ncbi:hypothetical protein [uncultured Abyssibacter sp.]|uniref:hypothetical protein n=1 Tax=uncultured Abyssibacter sp. TaxID=2320202 RepID=UPI0032B29B30
MQPTDNASPPTPPKRVLEIHFSQTGQLTRVMDHLVQPLIDQPGIEVERHRIEMVQPYPFPWPFFRFFDEFPETVAFVTPEIKAIEASGPYDLIVLGYTPWYLSPAPPIVAFLQSETAAKLFRDTPVVTVTACRNMWLMAQYRLNKLIRGLGGRLLDRVVLADQGGTAATFITTPRWMFTGKKNRYLGMFPPAGVAEPEIEGADTYGRRIVQWLESETPATEAERPIATPDPNPPNPMLLLGEFMGLRSFMIWGALIRLCGRQGRWTRVPVVLFYALFLACAVVVVLPITMLSLLLLRLVPAFRRFHDDLVERVVS